MGDGGGGWMDGYIYIFLGVLERCAARGPRGLNDMNVPPRLDGREGECRVTESRRSSVLDLGWRVPQTGLGKRRRADEGQSSQWAAMPGALHGRRASFRRGRSCIAKALGLAGSIRWHSGGKNVCP